MLTRIRIEVEEPSARDCQDALDDYEAPVLYHELWRYGIEVGADDHIDAGLQEALAELGVNAPPPAIIATANALLGREITEEVIELRDEAGEGASYGARRVVRLTRIDTRQDEVRVGTITTPSGGELKFTEVGGK